MLRLCIYPKTTHRSSKKRQIIPEHIKKDPQRDKTTTSGQIHPKSPKTVIIRLLKIKRDLVNVDNKTIISTIPEFKNR